MKHGCLYQLPDLERLWCYIVDGYTFLLPFAGGPPPASLPDRPPVDVRFFVARGHLFRIEDTVNDDFKPVPTELTVDDLEDVTS